MRSDRDGPWVKATDEEMTGAFGMIENPTDADITVVSASSPSAGMMEIHEVVDQDGSMVMQQKKVGSSYRPADPPP